MDKDQLSKIKNQLFDAKGELETAQHMAKENPALQKRIIELIYQIEFLMDDFGMER